MSLSERIAAYKRRQEELIAQHGWMVQYVFAAAGDEDSGVAGFSYTVGLHERGLPELIVFSLPAEIAGKLLNDIAMLLCENADAVGQVTLDDWPMPFVLDSADSGLASQHATGAWQRSAQQARFLQVFWPDRHGMWPWQPQCVASVKDSQPFLRSSPQTQ